MRKAATGALAGLCLGAVLGYLAYSAADEERSGSGWTFYTPYTTVTPPSTSVSPGKRQWISAYGLVGIIHGGGLAAVAGAVIGGAGAVVEAIRENRRLRLSLEREQTIPEKERHG